MTTGQLEAPFLSRNCRIGDVCSALLLLVDVLFFNERQCSFQNQVLIKQLYHNSIPL